MNKQAERVALLLDSRMPQQAERLAREFLSSDIENATLQYLLAVALYDQDKNSEALRVLAYSIALEPNDPYNHILRARIHFERWRYKEALKAVEHAIELAPYIPDAFYLLSLIHGKYKRWQKALEAAEKGLSHNPADINCLNARAEALNQLKRRGEAYETLYKSLDEDPEHGYTHQHLGWLKLQHGNHKEAYNHFVQALRNNPSDESAVAGLKEAAKARNPFRRLVVRYFLHESTIVQIGRIAAMIGFTALLYLIATFTGIEVLPKLVIAAGFMTVAYVMYS